MMYHSARSSIAEGPLVTLVNQNVFLVFFQHIFRQKHGVLNWSGLGRDAHNYEDDEGDGEDGEERGEDDVRLSLDLLRGGHLADGRVAEHQHELEAGGEV